MFLAKFGGPLATPADLLGNAEWTPKYQSYSFADRHCCCHNDRFMPKVRRDLYYLECLDCICPCILRWQQKGQRNFVICGDCAHRKMTWDRGEVSFCGRKHRLKLYIFHNGLTWVFRKPKPAAPVGSTSAGSGSTTRPSRGSIASLLSDLGLNPDLYRQASRAPVFTTSSAGAGQEMNQQLPSLDVAQATQPPSKPSQPSQSQAEPSPDEDFPTLFSSDAQDIPLYGQSPTAHSPINITWPLFPSDDQEASVPCQPEQSSTESSPDEIHGLMFGRETQPTPTADESDLLQTELSPEEVHKLMSEWEPGRETQKPLMYSEPPPKPNPHKEDEQTPIPSQQQPSQPRPPSIPKQFAHILN